MKTIRTIATVILAAFLVLGPAVVYGAGATMTISTNAPPGGFSGQASITISGTITPVPTIASNVVITTKGPMGAVDINSVPVSMADGSFTYTFVAGGSAAWVSGQYTVNGTWGAQGNTATQTTTFAYTSGGVGVTTVTVTTTSTTTTTIGVQTVTTTTTVPSSDAAALSSIQASLTSITNTLGTITSSLNTISGAVTQLNTAFTGISGNISTLNNIGGQLTTLTNSVNNNQTYVLVVAALAAITLVLELAILVRKLS